MLKYIRRVLNLYVLILNSYQGTQSIDIQFHSHKGVLRYLYRGGEFDRLGRGFRLNRISTKTQDIKWREIDHSMALNYVYLVQHFVKLFGSPVAIHRKFHR